MADTLDLFTHTTAAVEEILNAGSDPLAETPCPGWNYAQLLSHLVGGDRLFCKILTGATGSGAPSPISRMVPDPDRPAPTPESYRAASAELARLLSDATIRGTVHQAPVGPMPGDGIIVLRTTEHFLHGWDLAKAAGAPIDGLEPVAGPLSGPALQLLERVGERTLANRRPFGHALPVGSDASGVAKLVAAFGRDPDWAADPVEGYARLRERFAGHADVELPDGTRHGFGAQAMRVGGAIFATLRGDRLMVKLPEADVRRLIENQVGLPMSKPGQQPMREWVLVPFDGAATRRAEQAYDFVRGAA